jgi:hypothetical protein
LFDSAGLVIVKLGWIYFYIASKKQKCYIKDNQILIAAAHEVAAMQVVGTLKAVDSFA